MLHIQVVAPYPAYYVTLKHEWGEAFREFHPAHQTTLVIEAPPQPTTIAERLVRSHP
jgi:hypothetical protein